MNTKTERALALKLTQWSARLMKDMNWTPEDDEAYYKIQARLAAGSHKVTREWVARLYYALCPDVGSEEHVIAMLREIGVEVED